MFGHYRAGWPNDDTDVNEDSPEVNMIVLAKLCALLLLLLAVNVRGVHNQKNGKTFGVVVVVIVSN